MDSGVPLIVADWPPESTTNPASPPFRPPVALWQHREGRWQKPEAARWDSKRVKGIEPSTFSLEGCHSPTGDTDAAVTYNSDISGVSNRRSNAATDPDLESLISAWDDLPDAVRAGIIAMVEAATPEA